MSAYTAVRDWVDRTLAGPGDKAALLPGAVPLSIALVPGAPGAVWLLAFGWFFAWCAFVAWRFWFYAKNLMAAPRKLKRTRNG